MLPQEAKHRVLDALAAIVSGSHLPAGEMGIHFARAQGGVAEATVLATDIRTSAVNAALANGMFAHADETDDFEPVTKAHPGSHVVPAALAMAEREGGSGAELLAAVTLGYDVCCRFLLALGPDLVRGSHRSAEGTSSTMGAAAVAASLANPDEKGMPTRCRTRRSRFRAYGAGYATPDMSKRPSTSPAWARATASLRRSWRRWGLPGWDVLDGEHNALIALSTEPKPEEIVAGLGTRFFITETSIKPFSVGYPIQAPLDAFLTLLREHRLTVGNVERIVVRLPEDGARIVNNRSMPDVNCQHIIALALVDGAVSFEDSHSYERMADSRVLAAKGRVQLIPDRALMDPAARRSGLVEVTLRDGHTVSHFTRHPPGTKENPLSTERVNEKARSLMTPVLGAERTDEVIGRVNALEKLDDVRELRPLLAG
jgi:2-methylcitrate dehydratase PrpD